MKKSLYIDASNSGIAGDMLLASLLDLLYNPIELINELKELKSYLVGVKKLDIDLIKVERNGIMVSQLRLNIDEAKHHRSSKSIKKALNSFLQKKECSESAQIFANKVLDSLIQAEAQIHKNSVKDIHLHELSSVDTLIDILGVTKALEELGHFKKNFKIFCSKLPLGAGTIKTAHGILAVPAPATTKILESSELVIEGGPIESELVTPTGAALLTNLNPIFSMHPPEMILEKTVFSTGVKKFKDFLNVLRIFYGEILTNQHPDSLQKYIEEITVLETDIDDVSGELIGNLINVLEKKNVLDIQVIPSTTKKNRTGHIIKVLCHPERSFDIIKIILIEIGTLGVRFNTIKRVCINREFVPSKIQIDGQNYDIVYKVSYFEADKEINIVNIKPEYEDLKKISSISGLTIKEILIYAQEKLKNIRENYSR